MKFKIGDKVRILQGKTESCLTWYDDFEQHVGKELVISRACEDDDDNCYRFGEIGYWWHEDWLELVEEDLSFSSTREIFQWLAYPGNKVISTIGTIIGFNKSGQLFTFTDNYVINLYFSEPTDWKKYVKKEWWKNIPEDGVLCWVDDDWEDVRDCSVIIVAISPSGTYKASDGYYWKYATPLTEDDVKKYILKQD